MRLEAAIFAPGRLVQITAAGKVSKVGAGYVYRAGSQYRCRECWKFIPATEQCKEYRPQDTARAFGTCILWSKGTPRAGIAPTSAYTPQETGYTEDPNGTLCRRCVQFNGRDDCRVVDRNSQGDTPGRIDPGACCSNQTPRAI